MFYGYFDASLVINFLVNFVGFPKFICGCELEFFKTSTGKFGINLKFRRGTDASSYSDSECGPFTGGSVDNLNKMGHQKLLNGGSTLPITKMASSSYGLPPADFDKRKRRKHELLEEVG